MRTGFFFARICSQITSVPSTVFPAFLASPSILRNRSVTSLAALHIGGNLRFQFVVHGSGYLAFQILREAIGLARTFQTLCVVAEVRAPPRLLAGTVEGNLPLGRPDHTDECRLRKPPPAPDTAAFGYLFVVFITL